MAPTVWSGDGGESIKTSKLKNSANISLRGGASCCWVGFEFNCLFRNMKLLTLELPSSLSISSSPNPIQQVASHPPNRRFYHETSGRKPAQKPKLKFMMAWEGEKTERLMSFHPLLIESFLSNHRRPGKWLYKNFLILTATLVALLRRISRTAGEEFRIVVVVILLVSFSVSSRITRY